MYTQQLTGVPQSIQLVASYPLPSAFVQVNFKLPPPPFFNELQNFLIEFIFPPKKVMLPPFEVNVENPRVGRGGTAVFRCSFPDSVRDYVTLPSWIQDNRSDIFLTSSQGNHTIPLFHPFHLINN